MHVFDRPGETPDDRMPLWTPRTWPGLPRPVVMVVPDSLRAVTAARWAARAAAHRGTDMALLVPLGCSFDAVPVELADEARAVAARVLPTAAAHDVNAYPVALPVPRAVTERAAAKALARALAQATRDLHAPLVVVCEDVATISGHALLSTLPADILFVPSIAVGRAPVRSAP